MIVDSRMKKGICDPEHRRREQDHCFRTSDAVGGFAGCCELGAVVRGSLPAMGHLPPALSLLGRDCDCRRDQRAQDARLALTGAFAAPPQDDHDPPVHSPLPRLHRVLLCWSPLHVHGGVRDKDGP